MQDEEPYIWVALIGLLITIITEILRTYRHSKSEANKAQRAQEALIRAKVRHKRLMVSFHDMQVRMDRYDQIMAWLEMSRQIPDQGPGIEPDANQD